ncbi:MAG: threonine ammonia-lyase IlvA [Bacteroidales bacterium]
MVPKSKTQKHSQAGKSPYLPDLQSIYEAKRNINGIINQTPLLLNQNYSDLFQCKIYFKREDLQKTRSYKLRGAFHKISLLDKEQLKKGIVCASAGNHAQGVALSCHELGVNGRIYMPVTTPKQKIKQVQMFGKNKVEIKLVGDTFDAAKEEALAYSKKNGSNFIPPFDDINIIEGQATIGLEILEGLNESVDYLVVPIGGGGLIAGLISVFKQISPDTKIIGAEPLGAPSMQESIKAGKLVELDKINTFVDGAAVKMVGEITFEICKNNIDEMVLVPEGKICTTILKLYNEEALVVEPAGALSISALDYLTDKIKGKNVVCIVSGGNNDIIRMEEIKERSMLYEKLMHYFLISFPQRPGALKEFVADVLSDTDDIVHFEYKKKNNRTDGPALVGIVVQNPEDIYSLLEKMNQRKIKYEYLNDQSDIFHYML